MNPAKMREYLDGSRLDEDDFVINDIPLKIPPTSIKIDKESFNFSFNTLRTKSDAIIKSGRSFVRISIDVIFQGEDDINSNLVPIVAGLRATPFCAVINKYIENQIQTIEEETDDFSKLPMTKDEEEGIKSYYHLKPVVLALTNMTFSTMGHENMTDCIAANFEFIWFNHLPYTPIWAYKVGPLFAQPGPPWESEAWKAFYQPFLPETYYYISENISTNDYPTILRFKELKLFHDIDKNVAQASIDLVNIFSNKKTQAIELFRKFLVEDRTYSKNNLYDKFYQSLLKAGVITSTLSDDINRNFNGEITSYTRDLLDDTIKNLIKSNYDLTDKDISHKESIKYLAKAEGASVWNTITSILPWNWFDEEEDNVQANKQKSIANREKSKSEFIAGINNAAKELKNRLDKIDKIDKDFKAVNSGEFNKEWTYTDYDIKYQSSHRPQQFPSTVLKLFGRNRKLTLSTDTDAIVTRISVSFRNNFSIIPMAGYRYPTCQYVGSPSPVVEFEINTSNEAAAKINQVYDRLDFTSLKFKQVPQGFINLTIENNFLKLFKLEEFQTESISTNTIPSQPNRSAILLQLADATVTRNSSLQDAEQLTQEFVVSDDATRQEIFKVLKNYLAKENTSKNLVNQPVAFKWFARIEGIVPNDGRTKALFSLIERARNHYNNLIKTTGIAITSGDSPQMVGVAEVKNLDHRKYGYIPNLEEYQKFVDEFSKHWVDSGVGGPEAPQPIGEMSVNDRLKQLRIESDEEYNRIIGRRNLINEFDPKQKTIDPKTGMPKTQPLFQGKTPEEIKDMKKLGLQKIGLFQYMQSMRILLDEILEKYLYLDDFQAARALKFKKGLGKGNPAYPDFYNQIKSVAALDKTKQKETIIKDPKVSVKELETSSILQYDPDTYLWYPIFDGSVSATNLIDPKVISDAKVLSKKSNENAQKTVNDFFANKYVPILKNEVTNEPEHKEYTPYRILEKSFHSNPFDRGNKPDRIELQPPLYEDKSYTNSSTSSKMDEEGSDGIGIKHQIVPDPSKGFPNWYPQHGQKIQADQVIEHTTNFGKLWGDNGGVIFGKQNGPIGQPIGQVIDTSKATKAPPTSKKKNIELARQFTKKAAEKYRVDEALILATIEHESGFNPNCDSPNYVYMTDQVTGKKVKTNTIKSRDKGFMQINDVAYKNAISKMEKGIFDPETNIMFGTQLIAQRLQYWQKRLGKDKGFYAAIASYNVGDGGVEKLLNQGTDLSQGPYVKKTVARIAYWQGVVGKTKLQRQEPTTTAVQKINEQRNIVPDKDVLGTHASPIMESIKEFEIGAMKGEVQSLLRAYPTFKLYFIEDDSGERKRLAFDDFFSYSAVKSIRVVKDKDIAADLLVLELTNISGVLSNRKFRQSPRSDKPRDAKGNIVKETMDPMKANTRDENPMTSLLLQEGTHIHLKLGFCADVETEILTKRGWLKYNQLNLNDETLTLNHETGLSEWQSVDKINYFNLINTDMVSIEGYFHSSLTTPNHNWPIMKRKKDNKKSREWVTSSEIKTNNFLITSAKNHQLPIIKKHKDSLVEILAWFFTEGTITNQKKQNHNPSIVISQSYKTNQKNIEIIRNALTDFFGPASKTLGSGNRWGQNNIAKWIEKKRLDRTETEFRLNAEASKVILNIAPNKIIPISFVFELTKEQLDLFIVTSNRGDGHKSYLDIAPFLISQKNPSYLTALEFAAILAGYRTHMYQDKKISYDKKGNPYHMTNLYISNKCTLGFDELRPKYKKYSGIVWCPTTKNHTWLARRNGTVYYTGNSNDPDLLDPVFTGKISEIEFSEGDNLITIVAQSYATELVMDRKGIENPIEKETKWWSFWGIADYATTGKILEEMISQPEVVHFGRWEPSRGTNDIEGDPGTPNRDLLTDKWKFKPNPADDNIFAPHPDHEIDSFGSGLFFPDIQFTIANTTIWDIFQEMTLRHPNYIASPVLYKDYNGERMTMFFGLPNQLYFARHPSMEEEMIQNKLKALAEEIQDKTREKVRASSSRTISRTGHAQIVAMSEQSSEFDITQLENFGILNEIKQKRFEEAKKSGYIKPFRSYHIATSRHHIVANNIEANSQGVATNVCIQYPIIKEAKVGVEKELLGLTYTGTEKMEIKDMKEFMMKLDAALPANYTNTQYAEFPNVKNINLAKRYGVAMLKRNIQNIYKGDITLIGNPRLKPYDVLYLFDEASDMVGPVEIKRVIHYFSQENGFVTEVVPQMLVSAAEWTLLNTTESIGMIAENLFRTLTNSESQSMSPLAWCIGGGVSLFGGSTAWKIINYASTTQPIVMSPLAHHGRIFAGGIPTSKLPVSIWYTMFGDWFSGYDEGYENWLDDIYDDFINTLKTATFQNTRGEFFKGYYGRSFDV